MYPVIFEFGPFIISSFGVMMVLAFLICNYLLKKDIANDGYDPSIGEDITFRAAIGGIAGAKLYYLIENIHNGIAAQNLNGLLSIIQGIFSLLHGIVVFDYSLFQTSLIADGIQNFGAGLVFLGGLAGGMLLVLHYSYKKQLKWLQIADWGAPYLALGHGIGRIGCFLVGDDYGTPSSLPWACAFPKGLPPTHIPVHPTQLYEMASYFMIYLYLLYVKKNKIITGEVIYEYLFLAGFARFMIEFIRTNPKYILGFSGAQYISLIMMLIGLYMMYNIRSKILIKT